MVIPDWNERCCDAEITAWAELKDALGSPEILAAPTRGAPNRVMTDVSAYGLGGVSLQQRQDGM